MAPLNAQQNWWGAPDGPSPPGSGDSVSGNVNTAGHLATSAGRCKSIGGTVTGLLGNDLPLALAIWDTIVGLPVYEVQNIQANGPFTFSMLIPSDIGPPTYKVAQNTFARSLESRRGLGADMQESGFGPGLGERFGPIAGRVGEGFNLSAAKGHRVNQSEADPTWYYEVLVTENPTHPSQLCTVTQSKTPANGGNVSDILVACRAVVYLPLIMR
ncbi:MAG: hypothetical protein HC802_09480 [Caldilineaceae bacterium]|nr:hypothetical protein [Caldilineaceae bacterium]